MVNYFSSMFFADMVFLAIRLLCFADASMCVVVTGMLSMQYCTVPC